MSNYKRDARARAFGLMREGKNNKEIAAELGVAAQTVGTWKRAWLAKVSAPPPPRLELPTEYPADLPPWAEPIVSLLLAQSVQLKRIETLLTRLAPPA